MEQKEQKDETASISNMNKYIYIMLKKIKSNIFSASLGNSFTGYIVCLIDSNISLLSILVSTLIVFFIIYLIVKFRSSLKFRSNVKQRKFQTSWIRFTLNLVKRFNL